VCVYVSGSTYKLKLGRDSLHDQANRLRRHEIPPFVPVLRVLDRKVQNPVYARRLGISYVCDVVDMALNYSSCPSALLINVDICISTDLIVSLLGLISCFHTRASLRHNLPRRGLLAKHHIASLLQRNLGHEPHPSHKARPERTYKTIHLSPDNLLILQPSAAAREKAVTPCAQDPPFPRHNSDDASRAFDLLLVTAEAYTLPDPRAYV
jgi:hypothetical protein